MVFCGDFIEGILYGFDGSLFHGTCAESMAYFAMGKSMTLLVMGFFVGSSLAQSVAVFATDMSMTSSVIGIGACSATLAQSTAIFAVDVLETVPCVSSVGLYVPTDVANR